MQAIKDGVARIQMTWEEAYQKSKRDIEHARGLTRSLMDKGHIETPPAEMIRSALAYAIEQVK
jgi:malate dehydrogenase (oxaloacetate-decarboxylating)